MSARIAIVRGDPTREEVVAVVAALAAAEPRPRLVPVVPRWLRAARLESVGAAPASAPADLPPPDG